MSGVRSVESTARPSIRLLNAVGMPLSFQPTGALGKRVGVRFGRAASSDVALAVLIAPVDPLADAQP